MGPPAKELDLLERQGVYVHREVIAKHVMTGDAIVKSRLQAIPSRVAQLVSFESDPVKVEAMLRKEFESALEQLNKKWDERG